MNTNQALDNAEKINYLKNLKRFKKQLNTEPLNQKTVGEISYRPSSKRLTIEYVKKGDEDKIFPKTTLSIYDLLESFSKEMTPKLIELVTEVVDLQITKTETELDNLK